MYKSLIFSVYGGKLKEPITTEYYLHHNLRFFTFVKNAGSVLTCDVNSSKL